MMSESSEQTEAELNKDNDLNAGEELKSSEEIETKEETQEASKDDFKEKYYYLAAEMDNLRKRYEREREQLIKFGNEKVLSGLIEVVDNLERTLSAIEKDEDEKVKNIFVGIDMVRKQFMETLKNNGLEIVEALGKVFDPNFHEALAQQPAEGKADGEVIMEYQKGYLLNGRLLRAAKVVVAKNN